MKNVNGSWKHKPPIFYAIVLVAIGAAILAIWRQYHPYDYYVWDALIVVFVVAVIVTCLYFVRDWWVDGRERNQDFQQHLLQKSLTPPPMIHPTKIDEANAKQKQIPLTRRPVKQLPPMNKRPFLGIGGSKTARQTNDRAALQANQTVRQTASDSQTQSIRQPDKKYHFADRQTGDFRQPDSQCEHAKTDRQTKSVALSTNLSERWLTRNCGWCRIWKRQSCWDYQRIRTGRGTLMLIGNIMFSLAGVILVDVDGSSVTLTASDALWLADEIEKHRTALQRAVENGKMIQSLHGEPSATWE